MQENKQGPSFGAALFVYGGAHMTRDELARIALRYDTALSRAMLRALGVAVRRPRGKVDRSPRNARYDGMSECFENRGRGVLL